MNTNARDTNHYIAAVEHLVQTPFIILSAASSDHRSRWLKQGATVRRVPFRNNVRVVAYAYGKMQLHLVTSNIKN